MTTDRRVAVAAILAACSLCSLPRAAAEPPTGGTTVARVDFIRDVQPLLERACYRCHGPDKQKSGYRLDVRDVALTGGELYPPNIVPGRSGESPLFEFIAGDGDLTMPPEGPPLSAEEVALVRRWIDEGAVWPDEAAGHIADKADWWSFKPLTRPAVPAAAGSSPPRVANAIDQFIAAKLHAAGLRQAPQADRRTLVRRVYFDLIGLPPTPEEIAKFVADDDPQAYERLVDRLLDSPRYGERWARHWMDAAHFAETHGHDQDRIREHAWPYRDYLIASLSADKPYAQFIQEQVAGDALFPEDPQATVALGFLAAGPWDESSLRDVLEDTLDRQIARYLDRDDMLATVMNNVASVTVQCARCHDHKFDPISQEDYYSLQAVFAGVERANRTVDASPEVKRRREMLQARRQAIERRDPALLAELSTAESQAAVAAWERDLTQIRAAWTVLATTSRRSDHGATLTEHADGSILSSGPRPETDVYTITSAAPLASITALRVEVLTDSSLPQGGPGRQDNGNLHLSEIEVFAGEPTEEPHRIARATADFNQTDWGVERAIDGSPQTAWGVFPEVGKPHEAVFEFVEPVRDESQLTVVLKQLHGGGHLIGRLRLSVTDAAGPVGVHVLPADIAAIVSVLPENRTAEQRLSLALHVHQQRVVRELAVLPPPSLVYAAASEFEPDGGHKPPPGPRPVHLLHRGDVSQPRTPATPGALSSIAELSPRFDLAAEANESQRRAALARWLTDPRNPLTWRSIVNRMWHHHFGAGIVDTPNDFGHLGGAPSHPELLDWLAVEFRDGGQSLKRLHRLIVTSETYRQTSRLADLAPTDAAQGEASDSNNRLLWRMNRLRMDAECVRDASLAVAGRLDLRMGGPSDRQFALRPGIHVTPRVDYAAFDEDGEGARRRGVYRFLFRTLPDPLMDALDCPSGDQITPARVNSVTVQQALALWNSKFVLRNAEHLAARVSREVAGDAQQATRAVNLVFGRDATTEEVEQFTVYTRAHGLANLCRVLLNANEFMFVD